MTAADDLLDLAYKLLGLNAATDADKYAAIPDIITLLHSLHAAWKIPVGTTGTISERLCLLGINAAFGPIPIRKYGNDWKWLGDFLLPGHPYDIAVSVKSFKAKERLLASGTGSLLTPTIGWGLFDDRTEWSQKRVKAYLFRGFCAIYMPAGLLASLLPPAVAINNLNGKPFLRDLADFPGDLTGAVPLGQARIDVRLI